MAKILFSPIGGTDPMSQQNYMDGSMLHITRVYKPEQIYLYLSSEMLKIHHEDNRFLYSLNKLFALQKREPAKIEIIEKPELKNVQEFDFFYTEFQEILHPIMRQMSPEDELLLNISSGTPAMKSALMVIATLREVPCKAIQVVTPERKMNEHKHEGYDVEVCWELNPDNKPDFQDRTSVVRCPALSQIQTENNIRRHILSYDYHAALRIAETLPESRKTQYLDYLLMAAHRCDLDHSNVSALIKKTGFNCYPFTKEDDRKLFEYLLTIQLRLKRSQYADFVRAISPALLYLFSGMINENTSLDTKKLYKKNTDGSFVWNQSEIEKAGLRDLLNMDSKKYSKLYVQNYELNMILSEKCNDADITTLADNLRSVEENIRNRVAHDIISVTAQVIQNKTGYTPEEIMDQIKKACRYAGIKATTDDWESYQNLNGKILEMMEKA